MGSCASIHLGERKAFYQQFVLQEKIGQGSYGKVYLVKDKRGHKTLAVKVQAAQFGREWVITDEVLVWKALGRHPNIVTFLDLRQEANVYFIVMEVCPRALSDRVMYTPQWTALELMNDFKQALLGLSHMHGKRVIHRDIKVQTFLYGGQDDRTLKLADFGLSVQLRPGEKLDSVCGSPAFMAPEMVMRQGYDFKIDMWSMGVTFFMVMHGTLLVGKPKMSVPEMKDAIKSTSATKLAMQTAMHKAEASVGEERDMKYSALDVVRQLTIRDPVQRVGPKEALKLPFLQLAEDASQEDAAKYDKILLVDRPPAAKKKAVTEPEGSGKPVPPKTNPSDLLPVVPGGGSSQPFTASGGKPHIAAQSGEQSPSGAGKDKKRRAKSSHVILLERGEGLAQRPPSDQLDSPVSFRGVEGGASSMKLQRFKSASNIEGSRHAAREVSNELFDPDASGESVRMSVTNALMQAYRGGSRRLIDSGMVRAHSGFISPDSSYALGGLESFRAAPSEDQGPRSHLVAPPQNFRSGGASSSGAMSASQFHAAVGESPVRHQRSLPMAYKARADGGSPFLIVSEENHSSLKLPGSIQERLEGGHAD